MVTGVDPVPGTQNGIPASTYVVYGFHDPSVTPTAGLPGMLFLRVAPGLLPGNPVGVWQKHTTDDADTNWSPVGGSSSTDTDYKDPVDTVNPIATNVNLAAPGASINGVVMAAGMSFLVVNQTLPAENGIYDWNGAAVPATRRADANTDAEVTKGMFTWVNSGPTQRGLTGWILTTPNPITLGVTALSFSQIPIAAGQQTRIPGLFWVASNGTDANPSTRGAIASPFATIQAAITQAVAEGYGNGNQLTVMVMPSASTYAGFTTSPGINVSGLATNRFSPRVEHANISPDGAGINSNTNASISNLQLRSTLQASLNFPAGNLGRWVVNNCRIIGPTLAINALSMDNAGSVLELVNCSVVSDTATAAINHVNGNLILNGGSVESLAQAILVASGAVIRPSRCLITSTSAVDFAVDSTGISQFIDCLITNISGGSGLIVRAGSSLDIINSTFNVNAPGVNYEVEALATIRKSGLVLSGSSVAFTNTGTATTLPLTGVGYDPATPANYPGVAPADMKPALDTLASIVNLKNVTQFYVDVSAGSDVTGTGAILRPFASIPAALAAIALLGPGDYVLNLAAGTYAGAPIAWPGNVSAFGSGQAVISHDINYVSGAGTEVLVFNNVSLGIVTADLTLGGISLMYISNGGLASFTRLDATVGAKFVQIINMNINAFTISGNVICYNCSLLSGGPYVVNTDGLLSFQASLVPVPITVNGAGIMRLSSCITDVGCVVTGVGFGPPAVLADASSRQGGISVAGTAVFTFADNAQHVGYTPAQAILWPTLPDDVAQALDILIEEQTFNETTYIFQPGGTAAGRTYTSWALLYAALSIVPGPKTVYFDASFVTPCVIPAGAYVLDEVTFDNAHAGQSCAVEVSAGVTWSGLVAIKNVSINFLNTAVVESLTARAMYFEGTTITANGTAPIWEVPAGAQFQCYKGTFLNGIPASPVVDVLAGQTFILVLVNNSSTNTVDDIAGTLTSTLLVFKDASGVFTTQAAFAGTQTQTMVDNSSNVAYSPAVAGNYPVPTPTEVKSALDALANQQSVPSTVTGPQAAAKQIDLGALVNHASVVFLIQGLPAPVRTFDYALVDGATTVIDWTGLGLDGVIVGGENYSVQFRN